jgi:isocitrate/isopropylmalate dehydrogenase
MLFEPVHGSSPKYAGQDKVNPIAAISSVQLMFDNLGARHDDPDALMCADILDAAISSHLSEGGAVTYDLGGTASTSEVGQAIAVRCRKLLQEQYSTA